MAVTINSNGTITGIAAGGLPDGVVDTDTLAADAVTAAKLADAVVNSEHLVSGGVDDAHLATGITSSKLSGNLPALNGSALTNLPGTPAEACNFHTTNSHVYNITGQGQQYTCAFDSEISDVGSNFNTSTYTFTAPATGLYQLSFGIKIHGLEHGTVDAIVLYLITSNRGYYNHLEGYNHTFSESNRGGSFLVDMDASDTAYMTIRVNGQSAVNADFKSGSYFSGFRVT